MQKLNRTMLRNNSIPPVTSHLFVTDYLHQHPFPAATIKLAIEYLFPGAEIKLTIGDCDHHLPAHHLPLQMGVRVVLTDVMTVLIDRFVGSQLFKPKLIIVMQTGFIIIDKDRCGNVHGIHKYQPLGYPAFI